MIAVSFTNDTERSVAHGAAEPGCLTMENRSPRPGERRRYRAATKETAMEIIFGVAAMFVFGAIYLMFFAPSNAFYKKWPAIDEDEFVRRCSPETNREVAIKVRKIISDVSGEDYEHIHPEQQLIELFK